MNLSFRSVVGIVLVFTLIACLGCESKEKREQAKLAKQKQEEDKATLEAMNDSVHRASLEDGGFVSSVASSVHVCLSKGNFFEAEGEGEPERFPYRGLSVTRPLLYDESLWYGRDKVNLFELRYNTDLLSAFNFPKRIIFGVKVVYSGGFSPGNNILFYAYPGFQTIYSPRMKLTGIPLFATTTDDSGNVVALAEFLAFEGNSFWVREVHYGPSPSARPLTRGEPVFTCKSKFALDTGLKASEADKVGIREKDYHPLWPVSTMH